MKEKWKNLYNNKKTKILIKILIWLFIINESYNIYVDIYNFRQLEKAKIILEKIPRGDYLFYWLDKFNNKYNANIVPIKNCYYVSNDNWKYNFIFWFKLESFINRIFIWQQKKLITSNNIESLYYNFWFFNYYYTFPKYDLPIDTIATIWSSDINFTNFLYTISNPCQD
jgi:hypothetical protein